MSAVDSLPADQRAVLQLVLRRQRSYAEIARVLSIDPGAVRVRARAALDALGPQTPIDGSSRAAIGDYLLGQLPKAEVQAVRKRLSQSPGERAWARVVSSELAPLASGPLPDIPLEAGEPEGRSRRGRLRRAATPEGKPTPLPEAAPPAQPRRAGDGTPGPRSSRLGGVIVIGVVVAIAVVGVIVLLAPGSSKKKTHTIASTPAASSTTSPSASASATTTASSSTAARVVAQINLTPPAAGSKAAGIAEVLREGTTNGIAIVAQNVPPNTTRPANAYAVWLYNSPTDAKILGFVNPGVAAGGKLSTAGGLPANASHYKELIVTVETSADPKTPGTVILEGALTGVS